MVKYKVSSVGGALRARGAALKALRVAVDGLKRLTAFGLVTPGAGLAELALAMLDGSLARARDAERDDAADDGRMVVFSVLSDDDEPYSDHYGPDRLDRRALWLAGVAQRGAQRGAQRAVERAEQDRAHRLDAALRDDPTGTRFDSLDAEQEAVSGLRLRGAC